MHGLPRKLDLNLLRVLEPVHADGNASQVAEHLGMSQPAVSSALKRLRVALGDKLFMPTARGMQATLLAKQMAPLVASPLAGIGDTWRARSASMRRPAGAGLPWQCPTSAKSTSGRHCCRPCMRTCPTSALPPCATPR